MWPAADSVYEHLGQDLSVCVGREGSRVPCSNTVLPGGLVSVSVSLRASLVVAAVAVVAACGSNQTPSSSTEPSAAAASPSYLAPPAGNFKAAMVDGLRAEVDVPYTEIVECDGLDCVVPLDVLAPVQGQALPTIVLVPGGPRVFNLRRNLDELAAELARRGAVVFLTTYRSRATGNVADDSLHDVRCSVRYARSVTGEYGGDPSRVVLVGHSVGSDLVLQTAITPETATPGCLADGDGSPEAVVGLAGFNIRQSGAVDASPPMLLAGGSDDPGSRVGPATAASLEREGFEAEYREFAQTNHGDLVDPQATPGVVDLVFEAVGWTAAPAG
jgi:acetyl esterase/lipase